MTRPIAAFALLISLTGTLACDYAKPAETVPTAPTPVTTTPVEPPPAPPAPTAVRSPLTGPEVVALVAARYPEKLAGGVSHEERVRNMEFLRDRIIEVGTCHGLLLAWNRKTNGQRSIDAINWRHGAEDINDVVDLAFDYDNAHSALQLHWMIAHGPAGWDPYPEHECHD